MRTLTKPTVKRRLFKSNTTVRIPTGNPYQKAIFQYRQLKKMGYAIPRNYVYTTTRFYWLNHPLRPQMDKFDRDIMSDSE